MFVVDTAAAYNLLAELDEYARNHAIFLAVMFLFRNVSPGDPEHYKTWAGYEITYSRLQQICDLVDRSTSDWLIYRVVERTIDSLVAKKNEERLKGSQKDDIFRRLCGIVEAKLPDNRHIRHDGYKVIAKVQLNRYRVEYQAPLLLDAARSIPNIADRALVLFCTGIALHKTDRNAAQSVMAEALELAGGLASRVDEIERLLWFAEMAKDSGVPNSRNILMEAVRVAKSPDEEVGRKVRRLIDVAYNIDAAFASEVADLLDDDKAKRSAQRELELLKAKQRVIDEQSIPDSVSSASPGDYVSLGEKLLGLLQSERIDSIHGSSALKCIEIAAKQPLSVSYLLMAWLIQNAVDRHAVSNRANYYLRPIFEAVLSNCQLAGELAEQAFSRTKDLAATTGVSERPKEVMNFPDRQSFVAMLTQWLSRSVTSAVVLCDPDFGREDLEFLRILRTVSANIDVSILTCKGSQSATSAGEDLDEAYLRFWRTNITEQSPPHTKLFLLSQPLSDDAPIKHILLGEANGLRFERTFRLLGRATSESVIEIDSFEVEDLRRSISEYCAGAALDADGNRIRCSSFTL